MTCAAAIPVRRLTVGHERLEHMVNSALSPTPITTAILAGAAELEQRDGAVVPHRLPGWAREQNHGDAQLLMVENHCAGIRIRVRTRATVVELDTRRTTTHHQFDGTVWNGAAGVVGSLKNSCPLAYYGLTAAGSLRQWTPNGCACYDSESYDHEGVLDISWWDPAYQGRWWTYVKSPVAHSSDHQIFLFSASAALPGNPWSAGYDPNS